MKLNLYKLSLNPNVSIATIVNNSNGQKVIRALKRKGYCVDFEDFWMYESAR